MRKSTSGFTVVEILVVIVVIAIIATIGIMGFFGYQNQSRASQASSMANIVKAGAEKYFNDNGEYPNADQLTSVADSAKVLGTNQSALTTSNFTFCVYDSCSPSDASINTMNVFYFARAKNADPALSVTLPGVNGSNSCTLEISATSSPETSGPTAFATAFYSPEVKQWIVQKSDHGKATTTCQSS